MKCCILTEGGNKFGFGHIVRCTSFYDALQDRGYDVHFIIQGDDSIKATLEDRKVIFQKWHGNIEALINSNLNCDLVILDTLHVVQEEINKLCNQSFTLVSIDDYLRNKYHDSIILDWTVNVEKSDVHSKNLSNGNIVLLGIDYVVLRKPFWNNSYRRFLDLKNILITIGGSDIRGLTSPITLHLSKLYQDLQFHVIIGSNTERKKVLKELNKRNVRVYESLSSGEVKRLMDHCDVAISAGGQTLYELASSGIPTIAIEIINNQSEDINGWKSKGLLYRVLSWNNPFLLESITEAINDLRSIKIREDIYNNVRNLVNGDNVNMILDIIEKVIHDKIRK